MKNKQKPHQIIGENMGFLCAFCKVCALSVKVCVIPGYYMRQ